MRVHELAKELKLQSKDLIESLQKLKIDVKNHMSMLSAADVQAVKASLAKSVAPAKETAPAAAPAKPAPAAGSKPSGSGGNQTPSIESVKREFLIQRLGSRPATPAPDTRKSSVPPAGTPKKPFSTPSAPAQSRPIQRPKFQPDARKAPIASVSPAVPAAAAPVAAPPTAPEPGKLKALELDAIISVKDFADKLNLRPGDLITRLIKIGVFASINQTITFDVASKVLADLGYEAKRPALQAAETAAKTSTDSTPKNTANLKHRAPVVTFMGHVDHGKTSLLDAIRKTKVAASEAGGITQHIAAYEVFLEKGGAVTFLDTPGHEAFTAMRARGARATDVVVLVVAADDGVMPQTVEAIDHAKAAGVPIVVAINKIDLPSANADRVKKELMEKHDLMPDDWGGKIVMVPVSAKTGKGIDQLLEMLALESELLELRADPSKNATGVVVEAELSKGSGVLATVLVQDGTLRIGDTVVVGSTYGRIRAMINDRGQRVKEAHPSMPVGILGLPVVPRAGDRFEVVRDERTAKEMVEKLKQSSQSDSVRAAHVTLEHLLEDVKSGKVGSLKLILKSDVQGSVEALRNTLATIQSKNVKLDIIHTGTGDVSESDVMLAAASDAVVIGFHVGMSSDARQVADREQVDVRFYEIIYEVKTAIEKSMEGLLEPEMKEVSVGVAEVRQVFKVSKIGTIAGCIVQKGKIVRNFHCRVVRGGKRLHEGKVESLKRFKDDAREVLEGFECGIGVSNFDDIQPADRIEVFEIQKKARKLE